MKKYLCLYLFSFLFTGVANAIVINFDDIGTASAYGSVGTTHGFTFSSNMDWADISASSEFGLNGPAVSGDFAALNNYNGTGVVSNINNFSLNGFYTKSFDFTTVGNTVTVNGYNSGSIIDTYSFVQTLDWQFISLNMTGLDQVDFAFGDHFWLDDIYFNEPTTVPEPTSLALLSIGLAAFGFSRKKKKA